MDIKQLKKIDPRRGNRKEIEKEEDDLDAKKESQEAQLEA